MFGQGFNSGFFGKPLCFTDTTDIFKDNSGVALYTLDYDASDTGGGSGKFNEGAIFNGSSSKIELPSALSNGSTTATGCISFWFNVGAEVTSSTPSNEIMQFAGTSSLTGKIALGSTSGHMSGETFSVTHNVSGVYTYSTTNIPGGWNHAVVQWNSSDGKWDIYINSVKHTTYTVGTNAQGYFKLKFGNRSSNYYTGRLDQIRIYTSALTQSQITQLYQENNSTVGTHLFGCLANYNLDGSAKESMGTTAYDGTETDITYKYNGTPTNVDFGVGGKSLYGARFNGSSSYVSADNPNSGGGARSFSAWIKTTSTGFQSIITNGGASHASGLNMFVFNNKLYSTSGKGNGENYGPTSSADVNTGDWVHCALTMSGTAIGSTLKTYVNGTLDGTHTTTILITDTYDAFRIGGRYINGSYAAAWFNGSIDQVRIFNKEISASEVSKLYGNGTGEIACKYTATTTDIAYPIANAAYYKLDNNSKDLSRTSGKFNEGAIFNGSSSAITLPPIAGLPTNSNNTNNFTFSCWVKSTTTRLNNGGGSNPIFQNNVGSYQFIGFGGNDNGNFPTGKLFYYTYGGSGQHNSWIITPNTYDNDQWHHLVVTDKYNSAGNNRTRTLYVNGAQIVQDTVDKNFLNSTATNHTLGDSTGTGNRHAGIDLDQVRIFNKAISSSEVTTLYNETKNTTGTLQILGDNSCVATYTLDGSSADLSGNYSGTDTDVKYAYDGTESNIKYRFGKYGQAAKFPALASSYIDTGIKSLGSDFSLSFWFNPDYIDGSSGYRNPLGKYWAGSGNAELLLAFNDNGTIATYVYYGGGYSNSVSSTHPNTVSNGNWYHYCITWENGVQLKTYLNNVSATTTTSASKNSNTVPLYIGAIDNRGAGGGSSWNSYAWSGLIDQVRVYNTALTDNQVTQLYNEKPETDTSNFKTVLYEGNGGTNFISNVGIDLETNGGLVWLKSRTNTNGHRLYDSVRGATKALSSEGTYAEYTESGLTSFEENGFFVGSHTGVNQNSQDFVAWNWLAGGEAVQNNNGTIPSIVSANPEAGFSIVKYTSTGTSGSTVGHGLSSAPKIAIFKCTSTTGNWITSITNVVSNKYLYLNTNSAGGTGGFSIDGTNITLNNTYGDANTSGRTYIAYCWHSVAGYSKIGSYSGGSSGSSNVITVGFKPSFLMVKRTDQGGDAWNMFDIVRGGSDTFDNYLQADTSGAEASYSAREVTFANDGFYWTNAESGTNISGGTYIYMAFK